MAEKILIVDDDLETLRLVGLMLQRQGYQIVAANTGRQALSMACSEHPDAILLDVMMPDMDGYDVARNLRKQPETVSTPILMFTAKNMVDDKVAGYEAGVDDYIVKPVHPAALVTHIKSALTRNKNRAAAPVQRGYSVGVIAPKGGLGVSTLVLNLAVTLQKRAKTDVIAAELRPGQGSWGVELGFANASGMGNLLRMKPAQINLSSVSKELISTSYGVRLLLASNRFRDAELGLGSDQMESILQELPLLGSTILLDIGAIILPGMDRVIHQCQQIVLVTEPFPASVQRTRLLMDDLQSFDFYKNQQMMVVIYNRTRSELQLPINQVQDMLAQPVSLVFPPAPEASYNANLRSIPLVELQPQGAIAVQFGKMADMIAQNASK